MKSYITMLSIQLLLLSAVVYLCSCSVKMESEWFGKTEKDDRSISQGLYPEGVSQARKGDQRY